MIQIQGPRDVYDVIEFVWLLCAAVGVVVGGYSIGSYLLACRMAEMRP